MHGFVGQRARARDDADRSFFMDRRGHDADLALSRRDDAWAVWPDEARTPVLQELPGAHHVERWNAFGNANDQVDLCVGGFHDRIGGKRWWYENHRRVRASLVDRFADRIENRPVF